MKFCITGGAGFLGSYLVNKLLQHNHDVVVLDNLSTGLIENVYKYNHLNNYKFLYGSICDINLMDEVIKDCDVVYHLASVVGVKKVLSSGLETIETGLHGMENILNSAVKYNKKVIFTSTSEVYGKSNGGPLKEGDDVHYGNIMNKRWIYAYVKTLDEFLIRLYVEKMGLDAVIFRIFNAVGPGQRGDYGMVLPTIFSQAIKHEPITVYGDGSQIRCFTYVGDLIEAMYQIIFTENISGEVFNLGNDVPISILNLAKLIKKLTNSSSPLVFIPYEEAYEKGFEDISVRIPDNQKILTILKFNPFSTKIEQIINVMIEEYSNKIKSFVEQEA